MATAQVEEGVTHYGAPAILVNVPAGQAVVQLHGGQVVNWTPAGQAPVFWMPVQAAVQAGKATRGGIPICWPWFGPAAGRPSHGTVRTISWHVTQSDAAGETASVTLQPEPTALPPGIELAVQVEVGQQLKVSLTTRNRGAEPFIYSEALHTYFAIADISAIRIEGFDGTRYWDQLAPEFAQLTEAPLLTQDGPIRFEGEVDRVYLQAPRATRLLDEITGRCVRVDAEGAGSTVVWNPWSDKAQKLGDLGPEGWRRMVCIETANATPGMCTVLPGAERTLSTRVTVESQSS